MEACLYQAPTTPNWNTHRRSEEHHQSTHPGQGCALSHRVHGVPGRIGDILGQRIQTPLLLPSLATNALLAIFCASHLTGIKEETLLPLIKTLQPVKGRMHLIENSLGLRVIIDFAHTADAYEGIFLLCKADERGRRHHCRLWLRRGKGRLKAIPDGQDCEQVLLNNHPHRGRPPQGGQSGDFLRPPLSHEQSCLHSVGD
jgi:hypothetical protein